MTPNGNAIPPRCTKPPYSHSKAVELKRRREKEVKDLELRAYFCPYCGYWHLTSDEKTEMKGRNL